MAMSSKHFLTLVMGILSLSKQRQSLSETIYYVCPTWRGESKWNLCRIMSYCEMPTVLICLGSAQTPQKHLRVKMNKCQVWNESVADEKQKTNFE